MPSTDQLELLFDVQDSDASADASPLSASPAPPKAPVATPPAPLFPPPASSAPKPAGEPLLTLSPNAAARVPTPCPDPLPPGARWREVDTDPQPIGFVLLRSRRRSIGFVITDDGLRVTAPNWVTLAQIDDAVREKSRWIVAKLREWHTRKQQLAMAHTRWQAGGELPYLGKRIVLGVGGDSRQTRLSGDAEAPADGDTLWLALPADADQGRIRDAAQAWLQQRAGAWFGARLAHFLQISGLKIRRWRLSSAATRWGSCTSDGNIMLNWRLIHFAPAIIDYVIAHELAHLREMNHSQDFWREVGQILPDFEEAKNVLRRHDPASLPQF
ncbi:SprT family zinc-dependent metalloprotease [Achromobacter dolens]|uniref:M48 family metallopeptidase n=1 Tax=Achromobacter dolens TaxID=1287738 RepID=UPI0011A4B684|nr:SprT family zinc-dependent metalloprotease [Achromobacter dolens]MCZ8411452.1 SprT family zinc-dependent metalloprotease [Achromobacter dolens]